MGRIPFTDGGSHSTAGTGAVLVAAPPPTPTPWTSPLAFPSSLAAPPPPRHPRTTGPARIPIAGGGART